MAVMAVQANMVRNRSAVLSVKEKAYFKQVCNLLIFESGACVTARKYSKIDNIHRQVKCVFEQKCQNVNIASDLFRDTLSHLPISTSQEYLIKASLLYDCFSGETRYKGSTLWNAFKNSKADFLNVWMLNYNLMSGETNDNDAATTGCMLPYVWLSDKNKAISAIRNRILYPPSTM
jgi:hypothetical protein